MKKFAIALSILFATVLVFQTTDASAQTFKSRKELAKERDMWIDRVKDKAIKSARNQAKDYEKEEGWEVPPGERPLAKMLEESWLKMEMKKYDPNTGEEKDAYIWATGNGVARNKSAAQMQAIELAKVELAGKLKTEVAALVTANVANAQLSSVDSESITEITQSAKTITSATLNNVKPVVLLFRTAIPKKGLKKFAKNERQSRQIKPGNTEVQVTLFYDLYQADIQVREEIKTRLKDKLKDNEEDLKKLMGM